MNNSTITNNSLKKQSHTINTNNNLKKQSHKKYNNQANKSRNSRNNNCQITIINCRTTIKIVIRMNSVLIKVMNYLMSLITSIMIATKVLYNKRNSKKLNLINSIKLKIIL